MTKLPHENRHVLGLEYSNIYPKYKVGPLCSVPGCSRLADHSHHIWRRSFIIGDKGWVQLWDGTILQNLTGLCWRHHQLVTENKATIEWDNDVRAYTWNDGPSYLLDPQPRIWNPLKDVVAAEPALHVTEHPVGPAHSEKCPTCRRALPKESTKKEEKRPRATWNVTVPVDVRENGADVLDTLVEECAKIFGHDETKGMRYFTIAQGLALVIQHGDLMVGDGSGQSHDVA